MNDVKKASEPHSKVAILVLGMHRSGTSMLAGILDCLGVKCQKTPLNANAQNPKGYFESEHVVRLNDEILAAAGTRWNDWKPLNEGWLSSPRFNEFRVRAVEVLRAEYDDASMIYLKDPRICRTLPLWRDALEELDYRVVCIHTHRHPGDVAKSMELCKNITIEPNHGLLLWLSYVLEAEVHSRDLPRMFTSYASLFDDWQGFANQAEKNFGLSWPVLPDTAQERVSQFIEPSLRHHQSSTETFLSDLQIPDFYRETLKVLESWNHTGEKDAGRLKLDGLRSDYDLSAHFLYLPMSALHTKLNEARKQAQSDRAEIEALRTKLTGEEKQALADRAETESLKQRLTEAEDRVSDLLSEVSMWTDRIVERDKKVHQLSKQAALFRASQRDKSLTGFLLNAVGGKARAYDRRNVVGGGLGKRSLGEPFSTDAYINARTVIEQVRQARKNGQSRQGLSLLRQFRAGARGLFFESVYAEAASFLRRMRSGLRNIYRLLTFR